MTDDKIENVFAVVTAVLLFSMIAGVMVYAHNRNKEIRNTKELLESNGYIELRIGANESCNTAEILAIKRCDIKYGPGELHVRGYQLRRQRMV